MVLSRKVENIMYTTSKRHRNLKKDERRVLNTMKKRKISYFDHILRNEKCSMRSFFPSSTSMMAKTYKIYDISFKYLIKYSKEDIIHRNETMPRQMKNGSFDKLLTYTSTST